MAFIDSYLCLIRALPERLVIADDLRCFHDQPQQKISNNNQQDDLNNSTASTSSESTTSPFEAALVSLATKCMLDHEFKPLPASAIATGILYFVRESQGCAPVWSPSLTRITGHDAPTSKSVQRVLQLLDAMTHREQLAAAAAAAAERAESFAADDAAATVDAADAVTIQVTPDKKREEVKMTMKVQRPDRRDSFEGESDREEVDNDEEDVEEVGPEQNDEEECCPEAVGGTRTLEFTQRIEKALADVFSYTTPPTTKGGPNPDAPNAKADLSPVSIAEFV